MKKVLILLPIFCVIFLSCEKEEVILEPTYVTPEFSEKSYEKYKSKTALEILSKTNKLPYEESVCDEYQDDGKDIIWDYMCYENFTGNSYFSDPIIQVKDVLNQYFECNLRFRLDYPCDVVTLSVDSPYRPIPTAPNYNFAALDFTDKHNITHAELDDVAAEILSRGNFYTQLVDAANAGSWFLSGIHVYHTEWSKCSILQKQINNCNSSSTFFNCYSGSSIVACTPPLCEERGMVVRFEVSKIVCEKTHAPLDGDN